MRMAGQSKKQQLLLLRLLCIASVQLALNADWQALAGRLASSQDASTYEYWYHKRPPAKKHLGPKKLQPFYKPLSSTKPPSYKPNPKPKPVLLHKPKLATYKRHPSETSRPAPAPAATHWPVVYKPQAPLIPKPHQTKSPPLRYKPSQKQTPAHYKPPAQRTPPISKPPQRPPPVSKPPSPPLLPATPSHSPSLSSVQQQWLDPHNAARAELGLPPMVWSAKVAQFAESWASQRRASGCGLQHSDGPYGENIFWGSGGGFGPAECVAAWVQEKEYYNYGDNSCAAGQQCGHYTQIVWASSVNLGCAKVQCESGQIFMTCNYDPPGNWIGSKPY